MENVKVFIPDNTSASGNFFRAKADLNAEFDNVSRSKKAFNYKYAELSDVIDYTTPILSKFGFSITQFIGDNEVVTILGHESGCYIQSNSKFQQPKASKNTNDMQALGSAISYMRRYAWLAVCGITQTDDDGASSGQKGQAKNNVKKIVSGGHPHKFFNNQDKKSVNEFDKIKDSIEKYYDGNNLKGWQNRIHANDHIDAKQSSMLIDMLDIKHQEINSEFNVK